jgi:YesN/AraC family two-component response regulator
MEKLETLWVDLTVSVNEGELPPGFRRHCTTTHCSESTQIGELLRERSFDLICFDFDYPERTMLRLLRDTKSRHPSLPVLMLTVQHSESLAVWAFRSKVWDYLVKPVGTKEAERCLTALQRALAHRREQTGRMAAVRSDRIPGEVSYTPKPEACSVAAALYYVEQNFHSRIKSEDVAGLCGLSPFRFSRLFKETFGITFRDYLVSYRLKEACRLLENPTVSVADVAFAVGFNDPSYFTRIFKHRVGVAPSVLIGQPPMAVREAGARVVAELPRTVS